MLPPLGPPVYTENLQGSQTVVQAKTKTHLPMEKYYAFSKCPHVANVVLRPQNEVHHCMVGTQFIHLQF